VTLSEVMTSLRAAYLDWEGVLVDPNYVRVSERKVTWGNDNGDYPGSPLTVSQVVRLTEAGQYSFRLAPDGALVQIHFEWSANGALSKAGLAYLAKRPLVDEPGQLFPDADELAAGEQPDEGEEDEAWHGEVDEDVKGVPVHDDDADLKMDLRDELLVGLEEDEVAPWIRFDYDPGAGKRGILHHDTHLHFVGFPNTRVAVNGVPTPRQFIEFVMGAFYPSEYAAKRLDRDYLFRNQRAIENLNEVACPTMGATPLHLVAHLALPGCGAPGRAAPAAPKERKR